MDITTRSVIECILITIPIGIVAVRIINKRIKRKIHVIWNTCASAFVLYQKIFFYKRILAVVVKPCEVYQFVHHVHGVLVFEDQISHDKLERRKRRR